VCHKRIGEIYSRVSASDIFASLRLYNKSFVPYNPNNIITINCLHTIKVVYLKIINLIFAYRAKFIFRTKFRCYSTLNAKTNIRKVTYLAAV